jgi:type I restriction-modification system DNA methylase subunit
MKIEQNVIDVLVKCRVEGNNLFLPPNLERKLYVKTNDALMSIGLKWNKKLTCHVSESDVEDKLEEIINTGEYESLKDKKKELQFFTTPKNIAELVVNLAQIGGLHDVLEPSCGRGGLVSEINKKVPCAIIEKDEENYNYTLKSFNCIGYKENGNRDFLSVKPVEEFDRVVMNPPFSKQQDVDHILHAWEFLKPGGILVSICSPSPFFRENKKSIDFRQFLEDNEADIHDLPEGSFKESGTNIRTKIIKVVKN